MGSSYSICARDVKHEILVENPEKTPFEDLSVEGLNNIGCYCTHWIQMAQDRVKWLITSVNVRFP